MRSGPCTRRREEVPLLIGSSPVGPVREAIGFGARVEVLGRLIGVTERRDSDGAEQD